MLLVEETYCLSPSAPQNTEIETERPNEGWLTTVTVAHAERRIAVADGGAVALLSRMLQHVPAMEAAAAKRPPIPKRHCAAFYAD